MKWLKGIELVERMDRFIRLGATGTANELARKLGISRSTVYLYINTMREMGAPIYYCKKNRSFCYSYEVRFIFGFVEGNKNN